MRIFLTPVADVGQFLFQPGSYFPVGERWQRHLIVAVNPANTDAINNLASVYFNRQKYRQAIEMYGKAIKVNPATVAPYANIAACYLQMAVYDSAIIYSNKALKIDPAFPVARNVLANAQQASIKQNITKGNKPAKKETKRIAMK